MPKPNNARDRARLREEARAENARRRGRRKGGSKILLYIMLGVLLVGTLVTLSFTVLFKIETVEVTGDAPYDTQTILDTAGIQPGQNLLALSGKKINERLTAALPYIGQAKLHRSLPSKLVLEVQRAEVARAYLLEDGYAWCDASDKVLEKSTLRPEQGLVVQCQSITAGQAGQAIVFADSTEKELLFFILGQMELEGLTQDITRLDLSDPYDIKAVYQNRIVIEIGVQTSLPYKLKAAKKMVDSAGSGKTGTLDVSNLSQDNNTYYFRNGPYEDPLPDFSAQSQPAQE